MGEKNIDKWRNTLYDEEENEKFVDTLSVFAFFILRSFDFLLCGIDSCYDEKTVALDEFVFRWQSEGVIFNERHLHPNHVSNGYCLV